MFNTEKEKLRMADSVASKSTQQGIQIVRQTDRQRIELTGGQCE